MAFQCGFFNSVNGDRKYNAEQMNNPYKGIVSNGVLAKTDDSNAFQVLAVSGLEIVIKEGYGIFADKWAILDADMPMTIPTPNVSYTRIDSVIVRVDIADDVRAGSIEYVQGTPSESPTPPTLTRNSTITEYRLANITVAPNALEITQAEIVDTRPTSECGFVSNLLQNSDISALYLNWEAQFCKWFNNLKTNLTAITAIKDFVSYYTTTEENETVIPINIERYNSSFDILHVYINGMIVVPTLDYTINSYESITLTKPVDAGTQIMFIVYKTIDDADNETVASDLNQLYAKTDNLQEQIDTTNEQINEQVNLRQEFTYVVNSDQALLDWANNVEGNEYTSVLIKKGTWTSSVGVNLTATGTKVVVGEAGSKLVFNECEEGLSYNISPETSDYYMHGVNIEIINNEGDCKGFYNCTNLTNCTGTSTANNTTNTAYAFGFSNCTNLTNCTGTGTASGFTDTDGDLCSLAYGFYICTNLTNCTGTGTGIPSFFIDDVEGREIIGTANAYGFYKSKGVSKCKAGGNCTTDAFSDCYASQSESSFVVADTPFGGFNNITNPST